MKGPSVLAVVSLAAGCGGDGEEDFDVAAQEIGAGQHISDAANPPGTTGFYFLPTLVDTTPVFGGEAFSGVAIKSRLRVRILEIDCVTTATLGTINAGLPITAAYGAPSELYRVSTSVSALGLTTAVGRCFRVQPLLDGFPLGFRDAQVVAGQGAAAAGYRKWGTSGNLVFNFRLEGDFTTDGDGDGVTNRIDNCPTTSNANQADSNGNGIGDACEVVDLCPNDPSKTVPGHCGCGNADVDSDSDGHFAGPSGNDGDGTCDDECDTDNTKVTQGVCGCGVPETDSDNDGIKNCVESCDDDPFKTTPGHCGCGEFDVDSNHDGVVDGTDSCGLCSSIP